jgi:O-acetylserine/cysteine efflux transporter
VLLAAALLREPMSLRQGIGIGLAVIGLVAIAVARAQSAALLPVLLTLLGALGWAFGNLANRLAVRDAGEPAPHPMQLTLWMSVIPPVPLLAMSWAVEGPAAGWHALRAAVTPAGRPGVLALAYVAVLATVVGSGIWTALMRRYPAGVVAPYSLLVPVVGIALAATVLGERPSAVELVSAAVIVRGVLLGTPRRPPALLTDPGGRWRPTGGVLRLGRGRGEVTRGRGSLRDPAGHRRRPACPHARPGARRPAVR